MLRQLIFFNPPHRGRRVAKGCWVRLPLQRDAAGPAHRPMGPAAPGNADRGSALRRGSQGKGCLGSVSQIFTRKICCRCRAEIHHRRFMTIPFIYLANSKILSDATRRIRKAESEIRTDFRLFFFDMLPPPMPV